VPCIAFNEHAELCGYRGLENMSPALKGIPGKSELLRGELPRSVGAPRNFGHAGTARTFTGQNLRAQKREEGVKHVRFKTLVRPPIIKRSD